MTDRLERLLNLVIALREARRPMPAEEIRDRVAGYGQPDHEVFRRMFERDKADLRRLGVPLETAPADRLAETVGYRIDPRRAELSALSLDAEEIAALSVAVAVTGLGDLAQRGLRKLEVDADAPGVAAQTPHPPVAVAADAPHLTDLLLAQRTATPVRFRYRTADARESTRTVDPHGLVHRAGHWYLVGQDHDREATRAFRLDRVVGRIDEAGDPGSASAPAAPVDVDAVLPPLPPQRSAEVLATGAAVPRIRPVADGPGTIRDDGWVAFSVPFHQEEWLVGLVLAAAPEAVLAAPRSVAARLRRAAAQLAEVGA